MTSEIEAKQKELEDNYMKWKGALNRVALENFNLGIKMARKEKIKEEIDWLESSRNWLTFEDRGQEAITKRINQLKQSLEDKKQ